MPAELTPSASLKQLNAELYRDQIDAGLAAGTIEIQSFDGVPLATFTLSYPCGWHTDGSLIFGSIAPVGASASGTAHKAVFKTSAGATVLETNVSSSTGTAFCRLTTTNIVAGAPVSVSSGEIKF